jgi:hypothetical protein
MTVTDIDPRISALLEVLADLPACTHTTLWRKHFPNVEATLRAWARSRNLAIEERIFDDGGHVLSVDRPTNCSNLVTVRLDDPWEADQPETPPVIGTHDTWSPAQHASDGAQQ